MLRRGRERGFGVFERAIRLMGIVREHTHRVRMMRGAERWSMNIKGVGDRVLLGVSINDESGRRVREAIGMKCQRGLERRRGVRRRGRIIFSIY